MEVLIPITSFAFYFCLVAFIVGIYKPWVALWWMEIQNRRIVFKYYGTGVILFIILKYMTEYFLTVES